jgi:RHS repeat-associated protein
MSSAVATARSLKHTRHLPCTSLLDRAKHDMNKNKTAETIGGVMQPYGYTATYDDDDRLATWTRDDSNLTQSWNLSPVGDWTSFTENSVVENRTHGPTHELTAINSTPMTYDAKGNLTTNSNGQTYTWDFDNRMATAIVPVGCPDGIEGTHSYGYDALGRRVSKTVDGQATVLVCLTHPLEHSSYAGQVVAEYTSGLVPASPNEEYAYASYIDEPLLKDGTGGTVFYHANNLYCVAALSDTSGTVVERMAYSAYGTTMVRTADGASARTTSIAANPVAYTGRRVDNETGVCYYRHRLYAAELGRFLSRDPIGYEAGDSSLYRYVSSKPCGAVDPLGRQSCSPFSIGEYSACEHSGRPYDPHRYSCTLTSDNIGELGYWDVVVFWTFTIGKSGFATWKGLPLRGGRPKGRPTKKERPKPGAYRCGRFNMLCHVQIDPSDPGVVKELAKCDSCYVSCKKTGSWDFRKCPIGRIDPEEYDLEDILPNPDDWWKGGGGLPTFDGGAGGGGLPAPVAGP